MRKNRRRGRADEYWKANGDDDDKSRKLGSWGDSDSPMLCQRMDLNQGR